MASADSIKVDLTDLVSSLTKFMAWNDEYQGIRETTKGSDAAHELMQALGIPESDVRCLIGGSNAPIFRRAAEQITELRTLLNAVVMGDTLPDMTARLNRTMSKLEGE